MSGAMRYLTSLEKLEISGCDEFDPLSDVGAEDDGMEWRHLNCLHTLCFSKLPKLESLPAASLHHLNIFEFTRCAPNLTSLPDSGLASSPHFNELEISKCPNLTSLPDGMHGLRCPNLTSLPDGMHGLSSLQTLRIAGCPNLEKKCEKGIGEDWPKIAHVTDYSNYLYFHSEED
uniref:NB-ARC domain-containing protein n=1 Tax=Fagus sylvatica TaxID=28930 RepID=A0A2N9IAG5_FAGSY